MAHPRLSLIAVSLQLARGQTCTLCSWWQSPVALTLLLTKIVKHWLCCSAVGASAQSGERSRPLVINLSALRNARVSAAAQKSLDEAVVVDGLQRAKPKERKSSGPPQPQPLKQK